MYKNSLSDVRPLSDKISGFWRGVVEDNNDPWKAGRVRVRIHGLHTESTIKTDTDGIPVNELPWAEPCLPIVEGSVSGYGSWNVPVQGSHVMVFFEGQNLSQPRYFATMPGIPENSEDVRLQRSNPDSATGFKDPDNLYPLLDRLGEPDVDRLARGVSTGTIVDTKNNNRDMNVEVTSCDASWDEPESPYAAVYPHNFVIRTHGGVTVEMDSTPGQERVQVYHPSKSYIEIDKDGEMVIKNEGNRYEIVVKDNNIHIKENRNLTTDLNYGRLTKQNECIQVSGNRTEDITGDKTVTISEGDKNENITIGDLNIILDAGTATLTAPSIILDGPTTVNKTISVHGDGVLGGTITGNINLTTGTITVTTGDVIADGVSLKSHVHSGVTAGGSNTGPPV